MTKEPQKQPARPQLSSAEALRILEKRSRAAQDELARQTDAGDDVLYYLAEHGGVATRRAVAANVAAPAHANRLLSDDEDDEVRGELARKIARLMPDLSRDEMLHMRAITIELIEKLAHDQAPRVRAILADEIKHLDCVPKKVVDVLAHDVEEIVAAPILEYSPLLSDDDLIEIIAGARAEFAVRVIAKRQPVGDDVSHAIVGTLDIPAIAALLANPNAQIRERTLEKLVEAAEHFGDLHQPLVLRSDLSPRTIKRLASFVGTALLEVLSAKSGLDQATTGFLKRRLRERLEKEGTRAAERPHAAGAVEEAYRTGKLNEEFVLNALDMGDRETVTMALAALVRVPVETVHRIFESRSAKAVVSLVWKARLSMRVAFRIQIHVMKLAGRELLPARNGRDFPMSQDEMRWQLGYFDVPV